MEFDIEEKIQELKNKISIIDRESEMDHSSPKFYHYLKKGYFEIQLEQLEAIRDKRFHVNIKIEIDCTTFEDKEFPVTEFDLDDENTVNCAMKDFLKHDGKSIFD
jgi:hypothetical protein